MIVLSILFITRPWKLNLFNLLAVLVFCACSFMEKQPPVALADIYNCWVFYVVAAVISFWIVKLRVGFIRNEKLLECADRALYRAKEQGRNQIAAYRR